MECIFCVFLGHDVVHLSFHFQVLWPSIIVINRGCWCKSVCFRTSSWTYPRVPSGCVFEKLTLCALSPTRDRFILQRNASTAAAARSRGLPLYRSVLDLPPILPKPHMRRSCTVRKASDRSARGNWRRSCVRRRGGQVSECPKSIARRLKHRTRS